MLIYFEKQKISYPLISTFSSSLTSCDGENGVLLLGYYEEVKMGKKEEGEGEGEHLFMERGALRLIT
jgi:hypothetical protein